MISIEIWAVWVPQNNQKGKIGPWAQYHTNQTDPSIIYFPKIQIYYNTPTSPLHKPGPTTNPTSTLTHLTLLIIKRGQTPAFDQLTLPPHLPLLLPSKAPIITPKPVSPSDTLNPPPSSYLH